MAVRNVERAYGRWERSERAAYTRLIHTKEVYTDEEVSTEADVSPTIPRSSIPQSLDRGAGRERAGTGSTRGQGPRYGRRKGLGRANTIR
jgi:hypothetical protein